MHTSFSPAFVVSVFKGEELAWAQEVGSGWLPLGSEALSRPHHGSNKTWEQAASPVGYLGGDDGRMEGPTNANI